MRKTIFEEKMEDPKFKAIYDEISAQIDIGEQIAELRHKSKMTQLQLAKRVKTSRSAIARYESGEYESFSVRTLTRIARAFHKDLKVSFSS